MGVVPQAMEGSLTRESPMAVNSRPPELTYT